LDPDVEVSLSELVTAARGGDPAAWSALIIRHERLLRHVTASYRLGSDEAADVVQTTWLRLFENIGRIRDPERLSCWLTTTTARAALAASRRRRREASLDNVEVVDITATDVDDRITAHRQARQLHEALTTLSPRERSLIEMLLLPEEPSYREISRRLGMPIGSIGPVRQRALARLRVIMA
jgi:RNA polymerase sigma factor (sigma-70 family)